MKPKNTFEDDELWARLEELERQEQLLGELESKPDTVIANGEDTVSSEEEKEDENTGLNVVSPVTASSVPSSCKRHIGNAGHRNGQTNSLNCSVNGSNSYHSNKEDEVEEDEEGDEEEDDDDNESDHAISADNSVPTIYFSHTVEPKRVCILLTL